MKFDEAKSKAKPGDQISLVLDAFSTKITIAEDGEFSLTREQYESDQWEVVSQEKTYPIGFDPNGGWAVIWNCSDKWEVIIITGHVANNWYKSGQQFTTKEQAEKAAAGKNAMCELVEVIHKRNDSNGNKYACFAYTNEEKEKTIIIQGQESVIWYHVPEILRMTSIEIAADVINELSEEKIKLALEWGM